jgi:hypothetical protein
MNVVNGAPVNPLNCAALLGSVTLLAAGVLTLFRARIGVKLGLVGALLLWVFYGPLTVVSIGMPFSTRLEMQTFVSFGDYVPLAGMFVPILLVASTVTLARSWKTDLENATAPVTRQR